MVTEAANGRLRIEQALSVRPDLILTDLAMPEVDDGLDTIRQLRERPEFQNVPIVAMSAGVSDSDEEVQKSLSLAADVFLPKPIDLYRLERQLTTLLKLEWKHECASTDDGLARPLAAPPSALLAHLYRLAQEGDMREIAQEACALQRSTAVTSHLPISCRLRPFRLGAIQPCVEIDHHRRIGMRQIRDRNSQ